MKRLFIVVLTLLLGISLIRTLYNAPPFTLNSFLNACSRFEYDVLEPFKTLSIIDIASEIGTAENVFEEILNVLKLIPALLYLPFEIVAGLINSLFAILNFIFAFLNIPRLPILDLPELPF